MYKLKKTINWKSQSIGQLHTAINAEETNWITINEKTEWQYLKKITIKYVIYA